MSIECNRHFSYFFNKKMHFFVKNGKNSEKTERCPPHTSFLTPKNSTLLGTALKTPLSH